MKREKRALFLSSADVCTMIGISKSTLAAWVKIGRFPEPKVLGVRKRGWLRTEVDQWCRDLPTTRRRQQK